MRRPFHRKLVLIVVYAVFASVQLLWPLPAAAVSESPFAGYFHTGWMPSDGAPADVWGIVQDTDGWLWMGGTTGLYRFDGHSFERMEAIDGNKLHKTNILSLAYIDGALWVGYCFGGIERFKDGKATYFAPDSGLPQMSVHRIVQAPGGPVSAATFLGLYEWNGKKWARSWPTPDQPGSAVFFVVVDADGGLLINSNGAILRRKKGATTFTPIVSDTAAINTLMIGPGHSFWTLSDAGVQRYDAASDRIVAVPGKTTAFADSGIYHERDGTTWATAPDGIHLLRNADDFSVVDTITRGRGLSDSNVQFFFQDREQNIWLGTSGGIDRFRRTKVSSYPLLAGTHQPVVAPDQQGNLWISSRIGPSLHRFGADGAATPYSKMTEVETMVTGPSGTVWAGNRLLLARYVDGKETTWPLPISHVAVPQTMAEDRDGSLFLGILGNRALSHLIDGRWETATARSAYAETVVFIHFDEQFRLWQTYTKNRVAVSGPGGITRYTPANGLNIGNVLSISTRGGRVWVGGDEGLMFLKGQRFFPVVDSEGSAFMALSAIVETADGDLWLHGAQGISHIKAEQVRRVLAGGDPRVAVERLNYADGILGLAPAVRPLPSMVEDRNGRLWYATGSSVGSFDPGKMLRNTLVPPVKLRALNSGGVVYPPAPQGIWRLPARTSNLRLDYTALALSMPERVRFRYRLTGVDDGWIDAGVRRTAFYTNLGPGDYRFDVQAANEDGLWNTTGTGQSLSIAPTLVQTGWFKLLCGAAVLAVLWLLYRWRLHSLSLRMRARMNERLDERSRIARELHDTLLQSVQGLVLKVHGAAMRLPRQEPVRDLLDAALSQAESTIADGRNRVQDLRSDDDGSHLLPLLQDIGEAWAHEHGTRFTLDVQHDRRALAPGIGAELLAVCREAMHNAFQHAQARHVAVSIDFGPRVLTMTVADDGIGIAADTLASGGRDGHFGLVGMRERSARLGGSLLIRQRQTGGTECVLALPATLAYAASQRRWWY